MLQPILDWLQANPQFGYVVVPALAFLEAAIGVGLFVSGAILLSVASLLYTQQVMTLAEILPLAFIGAFLGDQSGFWIGRHFGPSFHASAFAQRYSSAVAKADGMIAKYGWGAILFGRLMTAIRSIVPVLTGVSGYDPRKYLFFDLLACAIWVAGLCGLVLGLDSLFG